ncbi:DCL family protein [Caballeronia sp. SBC2]|uniref:DCL family protein n=1 Tax=Caballeronia sp. SBC2 TaxID=2705547 RepID=UPI0013E17851|nr:DCL family protein [Caballeronia sp. SBC2]QIE30402.1 hypothetical protein SBC2_84790 [Caballeronia sp. SBC2]
MPAKPISLGSLHFEKRGDAVKFLKEMLYRYDVGDRVSSTDSVFLRAALENHPNAAAKIGCGISDFSVRTADYGTKCFWVNRTDGTTEKFSITESIRGV